MKDETPSLAEQKLQLEIEQLRAPWYKKSSSYFVWIPVLIAAATFAFDASKRELENQKEQLEEDIATLEATVSQAVAALAETKQEIGLFITSADNYKEQFRLIQTREGELRYQDLENQLNDITGMIATACERLEDLLDDSSSNASSPCD